MDFNQLYSEYKELVFNLALHYCQNREDAEEIAQEVFLKVYQKKDSFNGESSIKTWIYRITINQSLDFLKAQKRKKRNFFVNAIHYDNPDMNLPISHFDHPGVQLENKEAIQSIFNAINQLPNKQKTVIILLKIENRSQKEVAKIMDSTEKAIESLYQRAKKNLKLSLDNTKENE